MALVESKGHLVLPLTRFSAWYPASVNLREALAEVCRQFEVEGLYASPIHPGAVDRLAEVVDQIVSGYAIDGLHLDYIRYPTAAFDYSRGALRAFRASIERSLTAADRQRFSATDISGLVGLADARAADWAAFRRSRLNTLAMRLRTVAKGRRPDLVISAAVYPDPAEAAANRLQDWRMWLDSQWMDVICPMASYTVVTAPVLPTVVVLTFP